MCRYISACVAKYIKEATHWLSRLPARFSHKRKGEKIFRRHRYYYLRFRVGKPSMQKRKEKQYPNKEKTGHTNEREPKSLFLLRLKRTENPFRCLQKSVERACHQYERGEGRSLGKRGGWPRVPREKTRGELFDQGRRRSYNNFVCRKRRRRRKRVRNRQSSPIRVRGTFC